MKRIDSKKGGASSHLRPCKVAYCDKHNERLDANPSNRNIRPEFTVNNSTWKAADVPNLVTQEQRIRKDYYKAHGRHMPDRGPSKASPLKESVTIMPNGMKSTDEIHERLTARLEKEFKIRCIRRFNHRDEFCDETGEFNWHGHEVWDMYDYENHRMVAFTRDDCRRWQDIVAEETGMPRGNPAYETHRKWLNATEFKARKQEEKIKQQEENLLIVTGDLETSLSAKEALDKYNDDLCDQNAVLRKKAAELDQLCKKLSGVVDYALSVENVVKESLQRLLGEKSRLPCSVIDFQIEKELQETIDPLGKKVFDTRFRFVVDLMVDNKKERIVVDQDDYYKSDDPVKKSISKLFFFVDKSIKEVLWSRKKSEKKPWKDISPGW